MNNDTTCCAVPCDQSVAERPRYYARQLITSDDLTLEQDYFRSKLRLHNRLLHGWGVVCGAQVCSVPKANSGNNTDQREPWMVMVCPGYVLGPYGDEIYIDCKCKVDLRTRGVVGVTGEPCTDAIDPWCSEVYEQRETTKLYVAVRYKQIATRPVRVQPVGCGCDDSRCESSRWRDGYEIGILTSWPDCGVDPPQFDDLWKGSLSKCAPCPKQPWVVLAQVEVDASGAVTINNCDCRRLVASLMNFWWACTDGTNPRCVKWDEYENPTLDDNEKARLDNYALELQRDPTTHAYILGYDASSGGGLTRAQRAQDYLVKTRGIEATRVIVLDGGTREAPLTQLYIGEAGAAPPTPEVLEKSASPDQAKAEPPKKAVPEAGAVSTNSSQRTPSRKKVSAKSKPTEQ